MIFITSADCWLGGFFEHRAEMDSETTSGHRTVVELAMSISGIEWRSGIICAM